MQRLTTIAALAGVLAMTVIATAYSDPPTRKSTAGDSGDASHSFWRYVDKNGDITRPADKRIRNNWIHMGTWAIPKLEGASGPGMHVVWAEKWAVDAFNENHEWPDGAVLVKQVRGIHKGARTTGPVLYWEGDIGVWFVMVKDNKNRFPEDKRWGQGWGWALYKADHPDTNVNKNWKKGSLGNCYACHVPAKNTDWVYLEGYPVLQLTDAQEKAAAMH